MFSSYNPPTISSIYIEGLEISAKDAEAAAIAARDAAQAARDDALQYRNETHTYYTQVQQIQTGDYVTTQSLNDALSAFSFSDLASVPTSFTPSAHSHAWGDISGKPSAFTPAYHTHLWAHITDKPTEFEPAEHVHTWQQIAQKPGTFPPESHYHNWSEIEGKPSAFNPAAHTHSWGDISGKPTKFEPVVHTHDWSAIDNKPLAFPPESHTHHWDTITNKPVYATRFPKFSEVTGKPSTYTPSAHGHAWDEITGKPATATQWPNWAQVSGKPNVVEQSQIGTAAARDVGVEVGNLLEYGAFGNGQTKFFEGSDLNNCLEGGKYITEIQGVLNTPNGVQGRWLIEVMGGKSDVYAKQIALNASNPTTNKPQIFTRYRRGDAWSVWFSDVNSANTNVNKFGGGNAGEQVASGYARFSNFIVLELYVPFINRVRTLDISGTFDLVDKNERNVIISGVNGFSLSSESSNKVCVIAFNAGASLFTKGQEVELISAANGSYFEVGE